jgi:hypothetical protein
MKRDLLRQIRELAEERCDYCRMPSALDPLPFQVDHIIAQQHGGETVLRTRSARVTIYVLAINDPDFVAFRAELMAEGVFGLNFEER